jgi:peptidoglycan hydrolase-like protein with peptidoglycan-binding domain
MLGLLTKAAKQTARPPMTPLSARLTFAGFVMLSLAITVNALLLQPHTRTKARKPPQDAVHITVAAPTEAAAAVQSALGPFAAPPSTEGASPAPAKEAAAPSAERLAAAIIRELTRKGYGRASGEQGIRRLVIAYEFDSGLPLTGRPSEALLKRALFDPDLAPRGAFADRAESDHRLVLHVQKTLLELGFFSGAITGRMDDWTQRALTQFQRHRKLPESGRLTEDTLLDLIAYTGRPIALASSGVVR